MDWFDTLLGPHKLPGDPGKPKSGVIVPGAFRKTLSWLIPGWGLQSQQLPQAFDLSKVGLSHDPFVLGWAFASLPIRVRLNFGAGAAAATATLLGGVDVNGTGVTQAVDGPGVGAGIDLSLLYRVIALSVLHSGGAAAGAVSLGYSFSRAAGTSGTIPQLARTFIAQGGVFGTMAGVPSTGGADPVGFGIPQPFWIPAPLDLQVSVPATAGGESYVLSAMLVGLPANSPAIG